MRAKIPSVTPYGLAGLCLTLLGLTCAAPAQAARSALPRLPSAVAVATPGTGSAPILSVGIAGGAALSALTDRRPAKRPRRARLGSTRPL